MVYKQDLSGAVIFFGLECETERVYLICKWVSERNIKPLNWHLNLSKVLNCILDFPYVCLILPRFDDFGATKKYCKYAIALTGFVWFLMI